MNVEPDNTMIAAGILISLLAAVELYPLWRRADGN
jgi:hypothetical protein